ncbi:hypothetical protein [uncultured Clostridium sp.]|uniref:hypothetical protein n=1 Tax=uncultured Clostridium sp. TaxID=59620 RepID=UPI0028E954FB|nr:hypothetical protein [uncultured Clostridium sp.]
MINLVKLQFVVYILAALMLIALVLLFLSLNNKTSRKMIKIGNQIFDRLSRISLFRNRLFNLRTRIYNNTLDEDWMVRYKVILYMIFSWLVGIASIIVVISFFINDFYVTFTLLFLCYQVKEMFLDMLIGNDIKFLKSLNEYGVELQQAFNLTHDVRTAIKDANDNSSNYNLVKRMEEVEKIIDDEEKINSYLQDCPNEYLKLLILNCSLVAEHGDKKDVNDKSVFLENIFYNNQNIEGEVFTRGQLQFWLKGLKMLCILPFLTFSPYEMWAHNFLNVSDEFYKSSKGFLLKITITFLGIVFFYIISGYEKSHRTKAKEPKDEYWEDKLLMVKPVRELVIKLTPKFNSSKAYKFKKLISESGEFTTIEHILVQKIVYAVVGFFVFFSLMISIHQINKSNILSNLVASKDLSNSIVSTQKGQQDIASIESDLFQYADEKNIDGSYETIVEKLQEKGIITGSDYIARDVITKKASIENERISIIDFIISLIGILIGYNVPEMLLLAKTKYRKQEMENEIIIFETIILIFMYHEHGTSELILENMVKFADIFKPQVENVLKEIKRSDFEALKILVDEIKYKPFLNIVKNLIKAENIKTKEAFISLSDNRRNYLMNRREDNKRMVYKRVNSARDLSLIPLSLIIFLYIASPLLYISNDRSNRIQSQILEIQNKNK